ncbi:hypothetical protein L0664_15350 [Octadecabacter sp. G9-8]|uniref:Uncharacterized protein n=1 Tax=Octadecabacter dasysiphoniae TaxID=2909341 RepID=A0ABS9CYU0_9RHOB|nr:hypothetical protein [Octadecabacter dasysiphoniae]MCF2872450.1 hypothetical protein [Octadecabacter dasysiphoniae]
MRSFVLSLMCALCLSGAALADIEKPASLNDTLDLLLDRILPTFPQAQVNRTDRNITLDPADGSIVNPDNIHAVLQSAQDGADVRPRWIIS